MFAILITDENMPKIREIATVSDIVDAERYRHTRVTWYFVRGYVPRNMREIPITNAILPAYILEQFYEYDPIKIQTDWDQIVRK